MRPGGGAALCWAALAVVGLVALGCGGAAPEPRVVTLAELVTDQDAHDGAMVLTEGTVQTYDEPRHSWIEDADQHRVEVLPPESVEELQGRRVRVTGRFTFVEDRGRGIEVEDLEVLDDPTAATGTPPTSGSRAAGRPHPGPSLSADLRRSNSS